jgi:hypothetical protein
VRFEDGSSKEYAANAIAENLYSQVNPKGNKFLLLNKIVESRKKANAIHQEDMFLDEARRQPRRTPLDGTYSFINGRMGLHDENH